MAKDQDKIEIIKRTIRKKFCKINNKSIKKNSFTEDKLKDQHFSIQRSKFKKNISIINKNSNLKNKKNIEL